MNTIVSLLVLGTLLLFFCVIGRTLAMRTGFRSSDYLRVRAYPGAVGGLIGGTIGLAFWVCSFNRNWGPLIAVATFLEIVLVGLVLGAFLDVLVRLVVALTRNDSL